MFTSFLDVSEVTGTGTLPFRERLVEITDNEHKFVNIKNNYE